MLVKGSSDQASIDSGTLLRLIMPALPPFVILSHARLSCSFAGRPKRPRPPRPTAHARGRRRGRRGRSAGALRRTATAAREDRGEVLRRERFVPVDSSFAPRVRAADGRAVVVGRPRPGWHARLLPRVPLAAGRGRSHPTSPRAATASMRTSPHRIRTGSRVSARDEGRRHHARDEIVDAPPPGRWVYRIGLAANWRDDPAAGDVMLLSAPVRR